jgi:hypothetical protein
MIRSVHEESAEVLRELETENPAHSRLLQSVDRIHAAIHDLRGLLLQDRGQQEKTKGDAKS